MSIDEIREIVKEQISDPLPDAIMKVFKLEMQDLEIVGYDKAGNPITHSLSGIHTIGHYKTKLDAVISMIELTPSVFEDKQLKMPDAATQAIDWYEVYLIDTGRPNIKTLYILTEIALD